MINNGHIVNRATNGMRPPSFQGVRIQPKKLLSFSFAKVDDTTRVGLPGAVFRLHSSAGPLLTGVSDAEGAVTFLVMPCVGYTLTETTPPEGYAPLDTTFQICVDACGRLTVDGVCTDRFTVSNRRLLVFGAFEAVKVDMLTGMPLSGAEYALRMGGQTIATAVSTSEGVVAFSGLLPGDYLLEETMTPPGYQPSEPLIVHIDTNGVATINGLPADGYPLASISAFTFAFFKVISGTMAGLPGAVFQLDSDGTLIETAVSDDIGLVDFGMIPPGDYRLTETVPPSGYLPTQSVYGAAVGPDGAIAVDGVPLGGFVAGNAPGPAGYAYTVNYYASSIAPENLLGTVGGAGPVGGFIDADLTFYAPMGYQTPGTRSGAMYITDDPASNVVNVVYTSLLLSWYVEYFADDLSPANMLGRVAMAEVGSGTMIELTPEELDAYQPDAYQGGIQIGGPVAITVDGQVISVLYLPL